MHWIHSFLIALPVSLLGMFCGGFIGDRCVRWYRISSFEGGSGYFVVGLVLLGGLVGLVGGFTIVAWQGAPGGAGYPKSFGTAVAALTGLALAVLGVCWKFAHIPPEIDGRKLTLEVEVRLPPGAPSPQDGNGDSFVHLQCVPGHVVIASEVGPLLPRESRLEEGRWIVAGRVPLFTMRGKRSLAFKLNDEDIPGFLAPLPARPGREFLEWSDWLPRPPASQPPWPDSRASYRFRVQWINPPPPGPTPEEILEERETGELMAFEALPTNAPIVDWIVYTRHGVREEWARTALENISGRPDLAAQIGELVRGDNAEMAGEFLLLVPRFPKLPPERMTELVAEVRSTAGEITRRLREFNPLPVEADPSYEKAADISRLFHGWFEAVRHLRTETGADFTPELQEILDLARVRGDSHALRADVVRVAGHYLHLWAGIAPLPDDPKPR